MPGARLLALAGPVCPLVRTASLVFVSALSARRSARAGAMRAAMFAMGGDGRVQHGDRSRCRRVDWRAARRGDGEHGVLPHHRGTVAVGPSARSSPRGLAGAVPESVLRELVGPSTAGLGTATLAGASAHLREAGDGVHGRRGDRGWRGGVGGGLPEAGERQTDR